jgi:ATP-dependent protease ClpP protease subunit
MKKLSLLMMCLLLLSPSLMCCRTTPKPPPTVSAQAELDLKNLLQSLPELSSASVPTPDAGVDEDRGHKVGWMHFSGPVTGISTTLFEATLNRLMERGPEVVVVELNTTGGSVDSGFDMTKVIESLGVPTICLVDGEALSEGIYILQGCDVRLMTARSTLMVHEPYVEMRVDTSHLGPAILRQKALNHAWTQHVARRWKKMTPKQLREKIALGDWYINSEEALNLGAVDGVLDSTRQLQDTLTEDLSLPGGLKLPKK